MNKICGYNCEHNKGGVCQIPVCDKKLIMSEKIDIEDNWNKLKEYLHNVDVVIDYSENYDGRFINYDELVNKMQELEQGSDSNEINRRN